jgi:Peptidase A4 family
MANRSAPMKVAHGVRPAHVANVSSVGSYNWSGYADTSTTKGEFTSVSANWVVPKVTCTAEDRIVSDWVGLDGATNSTVEQDGTVSQCYEGTAFYSTWYELYPANEVVVGTAVNAGDHITASVKRSGTTYTLKVTDATTAGNNVSQSATCAASTCLDESAEWIAERPAYTTTGIVPLAQFAKTTFSAAKATGGGTAGVISTFTPTDQISMIDSTQAYTLDTTSALNSGGNSFSDTWQNSY